MSKVQKCSSDVLSGNNGIIGPFQVSQVRGEGQHLGAMEPQEWSDGSGLVGGSSSTKCTAQVVPESKQGGAGNACTYNSWVISPGWGRQGESAEEVEKE